MKNLFYLLLIVPFFIGCNQKKVDTLESRNDSLMQQAYAKDQALNEFLKAMNDIQYNLDSIKAKEMIINEATEGQVELKKPAKDQIIEDINTIYSLLEENKEKLADLRKQLGKSNYKITELEKMIATMSRQLEEKDQEIAALTEMLNQMDVKIVALTKDVDRLTEEGEQKSETITQQEQEIKEKTIEINTAYYVIGSKKDLKEANIITSEGGFIGIGKEKKLADDFNVEDFTQIDVRDVKRIPAPGRKIEIVTSHPSDSFTIENEGDDRVIVITNTDNFWKNSKYLVIVVQ
jgi:peptidoglycan hydrolase CwlO-like protein